MVRTVLPILHPVRWLREREWFWPSAAWHGCKWLGRLSTHPITTLLFNGAALAVFAGAVIVFHLGLAIIFFAVVFLCLMIVAKGARLKWRAERGTSSPQTPQTGVVYAQPQAGGVVNVFVGGGSERPVIEEQPGVDIAAAPGVRIVSHETRAQEPGAASGEDSDGGDSGGQSPEEPGGSDEASNGI